ncbi:MAG: Calx-beta domain-containing protein, partial [Candidatus Peribacteraceae bacterium]|nr:Calx-beta domain-containing protein [Candidatus Peribacteraceae bacterium]
GSAVFGDVQGGTYYDGAVGDMYSAGIITGYSDGRFGPNDFVTRGQVAVMMQRFKAHLTGQSIQVSSSSRSRTVSSSSSSSVSSVSDTTINNAGSFRFTTGSYKADESKGTATINVIRYGGNAGSVTVKYTTENGTATSGSDYDLTEGTLTFADGKTSGSFQVPINDDSESEQNETVFVKLSSPGGGGQLGSPNTATLTIVDNDDGDGSSLDPSNSNGVFVFSASEYEVAEDGGNITIDINRTSGTTGTATIKFETSDGTANSSYYDQNIGTLSFAEGESVKTVTVTVKDNNNNNGNKTINLKLSLPTGNSDIGSLSTSTLVIVDDEISSFGNGKLKLSKDNYPNGSEGNLLVITIDRTGGSAGEITVDYETLEGQARAGDDYTETSGTLTFKEGESQKIVAIPILADDRDDPRETFRFKIKNPTGSAELVSPSEAGLTIQ